MEQFFLIYLLSVSENVAHTLSMGGNFCLGAALFTYGGGIAKWFASAVPYGSDIEKASARYREVEPHNRKIAVRFGAVAGVLWLLGAMFPNTESVLKAYALIEGSKVINAENAEAAAEAVGKRFDRFLDIVDKSVSGRKETPVPDATVPAPKSK